MPAGKPATPLCDQFGFDGEWREAQLTLIGLQSFTREQVRLLHERVLDEASIETIVERFYRQLQAHAQAAELLSSFDVEHLRERQKQFLAGFGLWFRDAGYFEWRAGLGLTHARVGVPLSLFVSAVGLLQSLILECLVERVETREDRRLLTELVVKLSSLDIALATEVYQRGSIEAPLSASRTGQDRAGQLREQLERDALTGASSRNSLLREIDAAIGRAAKTGQPLVVVMADLDRFREINDIHGYRTGDRVLGEVAGRIKAALREFDLVGRYGGEEFVVLLENTSLHTARQVAERVGRRIAGEPFGADNVTVGITISQGLAPYREGDDVQALIRRADQAMHQAKSAGRNRVIEG